MMKNQTIAFLISQVYFKYMLKIDERVEDCDGKILCKVENSTLKRKKDIKSNSLYFYFIGKMNF